MRFIKSKKDRVAYNRNYITYIRMDNSNGNYKIVIGYSPCNDGYKEIVLADNLNINEAEPLLDKYLLELEEEPIQEYFSDIVDTALNSNGNPWN